MLDYKYSVVSPYLYEISRLNALSSGYEFGNVNLSDDHHLEKLEKFMNNLENGKSHEILHYYRNREYPDLKREKIVGKKTISDITLKDVGRQNNTIEERFRSKLPRVTDIRNISDPLTKHWKAGARGYERYLVDLFNNLDGERLNRYSIKPIII